MTVTASPYRSTLPTAPDRFTHLVRAEWTKLRTVRGWVVSLFAAVAVTVLLGLVTSPTGGTSCGGGPECLPPVGPDGTAVVDSFYFVSRPLDGDGSITVRVTDLTSEISPMRPGDEPLPGPVPWSKAGLIMKDGTASGSTYAAIMVTGSHGVRMQYDYTHDTAGRAVTVTAESPLWLRLTRTGATVTGYESPDGVRWTTVGATDLRGMPDRVRSGMFVTSPEHLVTTQRLGGTASTGGPTRATATFADMTVEGDWPAATWVGAAGPGSTGGGPTDGYEQREGTFTVSGSGDIAPAVGGPGPNAVEGSLVGTFAMLVMVIVVGALFITGEYRRGLIRTTLAACPRPAAVLAAKVLVLFVTTFVAGLAASALAYWLVGLMRRRNNDFTLPVTVWTELRIVVGTAALLALGSVLALGVGTLLRRSTGAVTAVVALLVLPYLLAVASVLPAEAARWLLRVTPAAAFAIQQSTPAYEQVDAAYLPATGYFPLPPWGGLAVLCGWAAAGLAAAAFALHRRDA